MKAKGPSLGYMDHFFYSTWMRSIVAYPIQLQICQKLDQNLKKTSSNPSKKDIKSSNAFIRAAKYNKIR